MRSTSTRRGFVRRTRLFLVLLTIFVVAGITYLIGEPGGRASEAARPPHGRRRRRGDGPQSRRTPVRRSPPPRRESDELRRRGEKAEQDNEAPRRRADLNPAEREQELLRQVQAEKRKAEAAEQEGATSQDRARENRPRLAGIARTSGWPTCAVSKTSYAADPVRRPTARNRWSMPPRQCGPRSIRGAAGSRRSELHGPSQARGPPSRPAWRAVGERPAVAERAAIRSVVASRNGRRLVTIDANGVAAVRDTETGKELCRLQPKGPPSSRRPSTVTAPRAATGSADGTVKLWDATMGQETATIRGHAGVVHAVAFAPDGRRVASAGADGQVRLCRTRRADRRFFRSAKTRRCGRWRSRRTGKRLALGKEGGTVGVANFAEPDNVLLLSAHRTGRESGLFPDGLRLATGGADGVVKVWNVAGGRATAACRP